MRKLARVIVASARVAWALPCSLLGIACGLPVVLAGGSVRRVGYAFEISMRPASRTARRLPFSAITLGHVIIGVSPAELARLRTHEQAHVRQYERLGVIFLIAYPVASLVAALRGQCPYRGNRFEIEACRDAAAVDCAAPRVGRLRGAATGASVPIP